jgi:hypothetical protein
MGVEQEDDVKKAINALWIKTCGTWRDRDFRAAMQEFEKRAPDVFRNF